MKKILKLFFFLILIIHYKNYSEELLNQFQKIISLSSEQYINKVSDAQKKLATDLIENIKEIVKSKAMKIMISEIKKNSSEILLDSQVRAQKKIMNIVYQYISNYFLVLILIQIFEGTRQLINYYEVEKNIKKLNISLILFIQALFGYYTLDINTHLSGYFSILLGTLDLIIEQEYLFDLNDNLLHKIILITGISFIIKGIL